jgi:hypothetical protein
MIKLSCGDSADTPRVSAGSSQDHDGSASKAGEVGDAVKQRLKDLFDKVAAEPVPDKYRKLLEELEEKSRKEKPAK